MRSFKIFKNHKSNAMKTQCLKLPKLFLLTLLWACTKDNILKNTSLNNEDILIVENWFNTKELSISNDRKKIFNDLKINLQLDASWKEDLSDNNELMIIPIDNKKTFQNNYKKSNNYLVLYKSKNNDRIISDAIFQFQSLSTNSGMIIKKGIISNLLTNKNINLNIKIRAITIFDQFLKESKFKDGKKEYESIIKEKENVNERKMSLEGNCIDWYLVTTYYFPDGSTYVTSEYVGRTCGNCAIGDPMNQSIICVQENGGSESSNLSDYLQQYAQFNKISNSSITESSNGATNLGTINWTVIQGASSPWRVTAVTEFKFKKYQYFDINLMRMTNTYDIIHFNTTGSSFVGSDFWIESTWNQISAIDNIDNNNSEYAKGNSIVSGSIKHKLPVPIIGGGIYQTTQVVTGNTLVWHPK